MCGVCYTQRVFLAPPESPTTGSTANDGISNGTRRWGNEILDEIELDGAMLRCQEKLDYLGPLFSQKVYERKEISGKINKGNAAI